MNKQLFIDINGTAHKSREASNELIVAIQNTSRCFVLASSTGELFDPCRSAMLNQKDKERGQLKWQMRPCSSECLQHYSVFLKTRNRTPFVLAQRVYTYGN